VLPKADRFIRYRQSALMANAAQNAFEQHPHAVQVVRFIGATPASSDPRSLLEMLCRQINRAYRGDQGTPLLDYEQLVNTFKLLLALATPERPLIIFLDALDQLSVRETDIAMTWLPSELPPHVRLVISALPGPVLNAVARRALSAEANLTSSVINLPSLSPADGAELLRRWMNEAGRTLQSEQQDGVLAKFSRYGLPLQLQLAFEEARRWRSYQGIPCHVGGDSVLSDDILGQIGSLFRRLERDHGRLLVARALGYLGASRHGLAEDELLDVLAQDEEFFGDFLARVRHELSLASRTYRQLPIAVWARLYLDLEPYMAVHAAFGTSLLSFYHRAVLEAVDLKYLATDGHALHSALAGYFNSQPTWLTSWGVPHTRKVAELPHQLARAEDWKSLADVLLDPVFLHAKCAAGLTFDLLADYDTAARVGSALPYREAVSLVGAAVRLSSHVIAKDWRQLAAQLHGRLANEEEPMVRRFLNRLAKEAPRPWIRPLTASLDSPGHSLLATFPRHTSGILSIVITADDSHALTGHGDGCLKLWHLATGTELRTYVGHTGMVAGIAVTPNGDRALSCASGSTDDSMRLWDIESGAEIGIFRHKTLWPLKLFPLKAKWVNAVAITPDGRHALFASSDHTLKLWDLDRLRVVRTFRGHTDVVGAVAISPDGHCVISGSDDHSLKRWDLKNGRTLRTFRGHTKGVQDVAIAPDGSRMVSASLDHTLRLWDVETGEELCVLDAHTSTVTSVVFTPDGHRAVSGSMDGMMMLWDLDSGDLLHTFENCGRVGDVGITSDGNRLVSGSIEGDLKVWDLKVPQKTRSLSVHRSAVSAVVMLKERQRVISSGADGTLKTWDLTGREVRLRAGITVADGRFTTAWDSKEAKAGGRFPIEFFRRIGALAVTPDGRTALTGSYDNILRLRDLGSGRELDNFEGHTAPVTAVIVTLDGQRALSASGDKTLKVWNLGNGRETHTLTAHSQWVHALAESSDGRRVISASSDGHLTLWEVGSWRQLLSIDVGAGWVSAVVMTPDGRQALSGSASGKITLWDLDTGAAVRTLWGHVDLVTGLAITSNGCQILSVSDDHTARLWDLTTGRELAVFIADAPFWCCAAGSDELFIAGDALGRVHFLHLEEHGSPFLV
jgi:WD40 repeat protein